MARPIFGGKKIDAPVFCQVWLFPVHFNRRVAETLSLLVNRYYTIVVFRHWVLSSLNFSWQFASKNATLVKTKMGPYSSKTGTQK